jgi:hypothetical protein
VRKIIIGLLAVGFVGFGLPPFGHIIKTSDDLWRIIAFIRSVNPDSLKQADAPYAPPQQY